MFPVWQFSLNSQTKCICWFVCWCPGQLKNKFTVACCEIYLILENRELFWGHSFLTTGIKQGEVTTFMVYLWHMCYVLRQSCDCCSLCIPTYCYLLQLSCLMHCFDDFHSHCPLWELKEILNQRKLLEKNNLHSEYTLLLVKVSWNPLMYTSLRGTFCSNFSQNLSIYNLWHTVT